MSRWTLPTAAVALATLVALAAMPAAADDAPAATGVRADMLMWINDAESKLLELAEATPEEKFTYRPTREVRSVADVLMHVATANYGIPSFWGVKPPEGFDMEAHEKSLTKKADIIKALKDSFAHMEASFANVSDADLEKKVNLFGMLDTTVRGGYMLLLSHAHEHLGQSIAYARMNGIAPPWTARQQAAFKEMQEKRKAGAK